ncbi:tyrosine-type recombinase/integrase [Microbacterium sp. MEC084]|uniref:tyrosine-type recombinase/integrase n=1 Tax=Microbacterium sp. MEC084 TaxID=1963027 RepID=UPI001E53719F|nr:tyrosine-type recombinase/integrase [Microbacterium sp. MEC084]
MKNTKTFREVAEVMQAAHAHTLKPKTRRDNAATYALHIYPTFGHRRINAITTMDIEAWLAAQRSAVKPRPKNAPEDAPDEHYSQSSIRTRYVALSSVFKYALQLRLISSDPCGPVRIPKVQHHELTFLTPEQVAAVVEHFADTPPDGLIILTAAYTGLRAGELEGLRIRDVNLFARSPFIHVQRQAQYSPREGWQYITPKSAKSIRKVPLNRTLAERLREHIAQHPHRNDPDAMLWPGRRRGGHGKTRGALDYSVQFNHDNLYRKHFLPALAVLGIPAVRWHDLRHFYASACAAAGIPIERAAKYMGHEDIATMYKHYLHLFNDSHTDDMDRLDAVAVRPVWLTRKGDNAQDLALSR